MANRRNLKRFINSICEELLAETLALGMMEKNIDNADVDNLLRSILAYNNDYVRRISHPEPGVPARVYFDGIVDSFNKSVEETMELIQNLY